MDRLSDQHPTDDQRLVERIAHGDSRALGDLYDRYGRLVYSLALNILQDPPLAEEITQEVFLQLWQGAASYQASQAKVSSWLASFARYRAIDALRRMRVRPEGHAAEWAIDEAGDLPDGTGLEEMVDRALQQKRIRKAMGQLPPEQRQALALAFFHGMSHSEIAATLHEPLGTIKTRLRLAMQKLRWTLEKEVIE